MLVWTQRKPVHGSCCSLYGAMMEFRRNLGSWGGELGWNKCLFPAAQSGAQTFRLIVSCHCQHETKVCDLSPQTPQTKTKQNKTSPFSLSGKCKHVCDTDLKDHDSPWVFL